MTLPLIAVAAGGVMAQSPDDGRFQLAQLAPEDAAKKKRDAEQKARGQQGGGAPQGRGQSQPPGQVRQPPPPKQVIQQPPPRPPVQQKQFVPPPPPKQVIQQPPPRPPVQQKQFVPPPTGTSKQVLPPPRQSVPVVPKQSGTTVLPPPQKQVNPSLPPPVVDPKSRQGVPFGGKQIIPPANKTVLPPVQTPPVGTTTPAVGGTKRTQEGVRTNATSGGPVINPTAPSIFKTRPKVATPAPKIEQVQQQRTTRVEAGGKRTVIVEPGNRTIVKQDNRVFIRHDEAERFKRLQNARTFRRPNGVTETFYVRPDGYRVVTEVDSSGRLLRRYRRGPDGREFSIIDNRKFWRNAGIAAGVVGVGALIALNLRPPTVTLPRERYIVDYDRASDDDLYDTLIAPPVERLDRVYSIEEIRHSHELRERVRRVDLDSINFDFGSAEVGSEEYRKLDRLAKAMARVVNENPDSVFMIEGHTDKVGSADDNLSLSDRRAQAVAQILTEEFSIPPENLVTQGYGEQHPKVATEGPERVNRRVSIRNVTLLMSEQQQQ